MTAIGERAADAPPQGLVALGVRPEPLTGRVCAPDDATLRRVLADIAADALDTAIGGWLRHLAPPPSPPEVEPPTPRDAWPAVAVDGKTLRGSGPAGAQVHLLAVVDHTSQAVLGQVDVAGKTNEISRFRPLLDGIDLRRTVVTSDAMHTQRDHVDYLVTVRHAADICVVKRHQPHLYRQLKALPWREVPVGDHTCERVDESLTALRAFEDELSAAVATNGALVAHESSGRIRTLHSYVDSQTNALAEIESHPTRWRQGRVPGERRLSRRAAFTLSGIALGVGMVLAGSAVVLGPAAAVVALDRRQCASHERVPVKQPPARDRRVVQWRDRLTASVVGIGLQVLVAGH